ncbi:E3 ubiquitin-protein ligase RNF180-like [Lycorma delicatula]|uniref:E3 ubiquitin-protein ligase RNF180-like n=1 Tax=Lycorma delicatula TaxID=130591 RepID=UPI003F512553
MANILLKCRKCRNYLNQDCKDCVVSVHSEPMNKSNIKTSGGTCSQILSDVFFIKDNSMPKWVIDSVNEAGWLKGKLSCPHCTARLGSFDFVSGTKCACNNFVLPPVHFVKSKIDYNII